ncbi:MAG: DoxX family protein [Candidatus Marinimicrobia bacterium]|nr:DoxX family protein [Candidatus Neomarinimicrobiota bacterium]
MKVLKYISIYLMVYFYISVGIRHFTDPNWFIYIIPPYLEFIGIELVYLSGFFEVMLGILLILKKTRRIAAYGLILLLIAVYPANIYLALNERPQELLGISSFAASWIRLPIQFILIGLAYWHSKNN